ncbi:protein GRAVITROPIC IN THE LIGHT 1 isoform X2 [Populus alba]|uniref:protein GRAVITROPIC IN THE LIGHT 1 isoform X2 n=1 Tax=Populus alba TaxID=43335 RepID=UPI003CC743A2
MTETMDTTTSTTPKQPQISEMFSKFALAFKTKTFEFFADEISDADEGFSLLDSAEDFIPDQKVIILKPDQPLNQNQELLAQQELTVKKTSYLQLQIAHVPFNEENIKVADKASVSVLQRLSDLKQVYRDMCKNPDSDDDLPIGSCLEAQVEENQSKLRILGTVSNSLQAEIDKKDCEVSALKKKLIEVQKSNSLLSKRLLSSLNLNSEVLLTVKVFDSVLNDACRTTHKFTKILVDLMRKAGWDLDLAANSVHSDVGYVKRGHNRYAFLSYVCLGMFKGFDLGGFGLESDGEILCNGHDSVSVKSNSALKQLLEHVSSNPMELLSRNPTCEFLRFCEKKYQELIHPTMESSIFSNFDQNEFVLNSWRSLGMFYESFVNMASSVWTLHKLAFSFDPVVDIFQVERGVDFSMVYMEDVTGRCTMPGKTRLKVGFTVVPGFKIGRTAIQSQVYLCGSTCTE